MLSISNTASWIKLFCTYDWILSHVHWLCTITEVICTQGLSLTLGWTYIIWWPLDITNLCHVYPIIYNNETTPDNCTLCALSSQRREIYCPPNPRELQWNLVGYDFRVILYTKTSFFNGITYHPRTHNKYLKTLPVMTSA